MLKSETDSRQVQVGSLLSLSSTHEESLRQDVNDDSTKNDHIERNDETVSHAPLEDDNQSSLERSYEVISTENKTAIVDSQELCEQKDMPTNSENHEGSNMVEANNRSDESQPNSRRESLKDQLKKSGSFLSKLQSSSQGDNGNELNLNLTSTIANAFSSISSFGSTFSFNANQNSNNTNGLTIETASSSTKQGHSAETKEEIFTKRAALERKNLISLTKLIVKDLISSSLIAGRTIENSHNTVHLNNYFVLIDRVLKHGLRQNLLSNKSAGLWMALDSLPKFLKESTLMSESVRSLAHTKTPDGKIKAWIRLAMMQKKLPEYFNEMLANKDALLKDVYHDFAFMLNDEAQVFAGLIIGVNVIDCNYFVKDANFDLMDEIIELGPYLRAANISDEDQDDELGENELANEQVSMRDNLAKILDQKNYLEEWNKRLQSTIDDLRTKVRVLDEQNSRLEMEAKLSEIRIQNLFTNRSETPLGAKRQGSGMPITNAIKSFISSNNDSHTDRPRDLKQAEMSEATIAYPHAEQVEHGSSKAETSCKSDGNVLADKTDHAQVIYDENSVEIQQYKSKIAEQDKELSMIRERVTILETSFRTALEKIKVLEHDLDVQTSINSDKETTIKIYEKDIREKQAQVESLRASMNDSKKLNSELTERLNDASTKLKDRINSVSNLQTSLDKWKLENKTLASRLQEKQMNLKSATNELNKLRENFEDLKRYNEKINDELKKERECGQSSSVTVETQNAKIAQLTEKLASIESELNEARPYRKQAEEFKKRCDEYEQSLEEVGSQLRESRLEVESLKENSSVFLDSQWMDSKQVKSCALCQQLFSVTRRKHHCRLCGNVFCQPCSDNKMELASSSKPVRVCDTCHAFLLAKFVKSSTATTRSVE